MKFFQKTKVSNVIVAHKARRTKPILRIVFEKRFLFKTHGYSVFLIGMFSVSSFTNQYEPVLLRLFVFTSQRFII